MSFLDFQIYLLEEIEEFKVVFPKGDSVDMNELNARLPRACKIYDEISFYFFLKTQQKGLKLKERTDIAKYFLRLHPKNIDEAWIQMIFKKHPDIRKLGKKKTLESKIIQKLTIDYIDSIVKSGLPKDKAFRKADEEFAKIDQPNGIKKKEEAIKAIYYNSKKEDLEALLATFYQMFDATIAQHEVRISFERISNFKRLSEKFEIELPESNLINKFSAAPFLKYLLSRFFLD